MRNDLRFDFLASLTLAGAAVAALSACSTLTPTVQQADRATADAVARVAQMRERAEPARVEPAQTRQQIHESWVSAPVAPAKLVKRPAQLDAPITINAVHPGFVASNFGRNNRGVVGLFMTRLVPLFAKTVVEGAATSVYLGCSRYVEGVLGK